MTDINNLDLRHIYFGGQRDDNLLGGSGDDLMRGGGGDDTLQGAGGADTIEAGAGADLILGGAGNDFVVADGSDTIGGGAGFDTVSFTVTGDAFEVNFAALGEVEVVNVVGSDQADDIRVGDFSDSDVQRVRVDAGGADGQADTITLTETAFSTSVSLFGGALQTVTFAAGSLKVTQVVGLDANDTVWFALGDGGKAISLASATGSVAQLAVQGGAGADTITGSGDGDILLGGAGADRLFSRGGAGLVNGEDGDDTLTGGFGGETLVGEAGNDRIATGGGADLVNGGAGNDTLVSNFGGAEFVFDRLQGGSDVIVGFHAHGAGGNADTVVLNGYADQSFADLTANGHLVQSGADVLVTDGTDTIVTLQNVALANLSASDFLFG